MKRSYPLAIFAAIAVLISSFTTSAQAQVFDTCEQFTAAADAIEGATIVDGIFVEEGFNLAADENGFVQQVLFSPTPQLTFDWGTLVNDAGLIETTFINQLNTFNGVVQDEVFVFRNSGVVSLIPDTNLGVPIGVSLQAPFAENIIINMTYRVFDGDTLLETLVHDVSLDLIDGNIQEVVTIEEGFIVPPGAKITRVEVTPELTLPNNPQNGFGGLAANIKFLFAPEPAVEPTCQESLASIAADISALAATVENRRSRRRVEIAADLIEYASDDIFFEENGERLSVYGGNIFNYSAYAIYYLQASCVDGADELVEQILEKLDAIVDSEIAYAIANDGASNLIDRAEDLVEIAEFIDDELGNEFVATIAYKLAWLNAYLATY